MKLRVVCILAFASVSFAADNPPSPSVVDQIVAKVNGDIVSQDELQRVAREMRKEMQAQNIPPSRIDEEVVKREKDALRDRIDELLLTQKGKELNINVDSDLSKYMANLQRQSGMTDPEKFHDYIRKEAGMSFEDFQQQTKNQF